VFVSPFRPKIYLEVPLFGKISRSLAKVLVSSNSLLSFIPAKVVR
jgi:hypothetical protein